MKDWEMFSMTKSAAKSYYGRTVKKYLRNTLVSKVTHKDSTHISGSCTVFLLQHPFSLQLIISRKTNRQSTMNDKVKISILPVQ